MSDNSEALQSIEVDFEGYRRQIEKCRAAPSFDPEDWKNAYSSLGRVRERYLEENPLLTDSEREALRNVFEEDKFTRGMMEIRQVAEHIQRKQSFIVWTPDRQPWTFEVESSARAFFASATPIVRDSAGILRHIEHLKWLEAWEGAVAKAIDKAKR